MSLFNWTKVIFSRQYKIKKGLLVTYFLVRKWMKNEASLALRHSLIWAFGRGSESFKLLWSFHFLRIWLQVLLHLSKKHLERGE